LVQGMWLQAVRLAVALSVGDVPDVCPAKETLVLVETAAHRLTLCEKGLPVASFPVALGSGGVDKKQEGDARTPLGRYPLARPHASRSFRQFLLIGYPTAEQKAAGLTGSAVGVHGPPVGWNDDDPALAVDWTLGCVALRARDLEATASWVLAKKVRWIELR
jgi:murein L,D-transpeptidase YafK